MAIPDEDVVKVRAATDIAALIGEHTSLKRVGRRLVGLCPFHGEKSPSFSVNAEEGLYYCFGCQASGDAISFVRRVEGLDFVDAVERLAARAGIPIRNDAGPEEAAARTKRNQLYDALEAAVDFYHRLLLEEQVAAPARRYLRSRGLDGETVRQFRIGFAPPAWDTLVRNVKFPDEVMIEAGLASRNRTGRLRDAFIERVLFPIFDSGGRAIALGGRVLPEELRTMTGEPGGKYRNSKETAIYKKSSTLYALNWAKTEITSSAEAVVCEGYTDVIGFFRAGVPRAVATCGTSLTEEHVRLLSRFAKRVVLSFDQDSAGQNAAARLYEWERKHEIELAVAALPEGSDPGELGQRDPEALQKAVANARPFLEFRVERALGAYDLATPEGRAKAAERAAVAIAEHPNELVRDQYALALADRTRHSPDQIRALVATAHAAPPAAERNDEPPPRDEPEYSDDAPPPVGPDLATAEPWGNEQDRLRAGRDALRLAISEPELVVEWIDEVLFVDPIQREAFLALAPGGDFEDAVGRATPGAAALLRRLSGMGAPIDVNPDALLIELVRAATNLAVRLAEADARRCAASQDMDGVLEAGKRSRWLKEEGQLLIDPMLIPGRHSPAVDAAHRLLAWLAASAREG